MVDTSKPAGRCQLCGATPGYTSIIPAAVLRPRLIVEIRKAFPQWDDAGFICRKDLDDWRARYVESLLLADKGELSRLEQDVVEALQHHETLTTNLHAEFDKDRTFGECLSDCIAEFGGSWHFIIVFGSVLAVWILLNSLVLLWRPFDPYPFILLNLILSCLAAIQAPIIMMSQNRQEAKDRLRAEHDYRINLKAELEIRHLHEKVDHLLNRQWEPQMEIQQIQLEILNELRGDQKAGRPD